VRVAGVSIAAALTATEAGRITMATQCHNVPGGIWGAAFGLLLDPAECSAVRQQVISLFYHNNDNNANRRRKLTTAAEHPSVICAV